MFEYKKKVLSCSTEIRDATFVPLNFCSESLTKQLSQTFDRMAVSGYLIICHMFVDP